MPDFDSDKTTTEEGSGSSEFDASTALYEDAILNPTPVRALGNAAISGVGSTIAEKANEFAQSDFVTGISNGIKTAAQSAEAGARVVEQSIEVGAGKLLKETTKQMDSMIPPIVRDMMIDPLLPNTDLRSSPHKSGRPKNGQSHENTRPEPKVPHDAIAKPDRLGDGSAVKGAETIQRLGDSSNEQAFPKHEKRESDLKSAPLDRMQLKNMKIKPLR